MWTKLAQKLKGWKTVAVNSVIGMPATLLYVYEQFQNVDITPLIPAKYAAAAVAGMAVLGVVLRLITTGPIGHKGDRPPDARAGS